MDVILQDMEKLIGHASIAKETTHSKIVHIGYAINPKFQNQAYTTEVIKALI